MMVRARQIVVDKSAFVAIGLDELRRSAKDHCLLVCEVLLYECGTSRALKKRQLLGRCRALIQDGAYYCSRIEDLIRWEGQNARPFPSWLGDVERTNRIRTGPVRPDDTFGEEEIAARQHLAFEFARAFFLDPVSRLMNLARDGHSGPPDLKALPLDKPARLAAFAKTIDGVSFRDIAVTRTPKDWIRDRENYCLSREWMVWQFFRLLDIVQREYLYLHQGGGCPGDNNAEHDYQDMGYVLLLSRADAVLTRDKKLVEPLARAAFPEKDVFSSLEEVPESYRCDWAES